MLKCHIITSHHPLHILCTAKNVPQETTLLIPVGRKKFYVTGHVSWEVIGTTSPISFVVAKLESWEARPRSIKHAMGGVDKRKESFEAWNGNFLWWSFSKTDALRRVMKIAGDEDKEMKFIEICDENSWWQQRKWLHQELWWKLQVMMMKRGVHRGIWWRTWGTNLLHVSFN